MAGRSSSTTAPYNNGTQSKGVHSGCNYHCNLEVDQVSPIYLVQDQTEAPLFSNVY